MEGIVVILGLCVTFIPAIIFANYIFTKVSKKTKFDTHLEIVKDKKGTLGVVIAYAERLLFGLTISSLGVVLSEYYKNETAIEVLIISVVLYVIVKFFDEKNEK
jgi:ABC-type Mn2+/Zn2+ transport system permease subunit